jgi:hypothetical protein
MFMASLSLLNGTVIVSYGPELWGGCPPTRVRVRLKDAAL